MRCLNKILIHTQKRTLYSFTQKLIQCNITFIQCYTGIDKEKKKKKKKILFNKHNDLYVNYYINLALNNAQI
jgi:hypothetical protein